MFCRPRDLRRIRQTQDDQRLLPISLDDQHVAVTEPVIKLAEAGASTLHFDGSIDTEEPHADILTWAADLARREAVDRQRARDHALDAIAVVPAAHTRRSAAVLQCRKDSGRTDRTLSKKLGMSSGSPVGGAAALAGVDTGGLRSTAGAPGNL